MCHCLQALCPPQCPVRNAESFWKLCFWRPADESTAHWLLLQWDTLPPVNCSNSPICAPILWHIIKAFSFFSFFSDVNKYFLFCVKFPDGFKTNILWINRFFFLLFICLCLPRSKRTACRYWEAENSVWGKSYTSQKAQNVLAVSVGGTTGCHADYSWSGSHSFTRPFFL